MLPLNGMITLYMCVCKESYLSKLIGLFTVETNLDIVIIYSCIQVISKTYECEFYKFLLSSSYATLKKEKLFSPGWCGSVD